MGEEKGCCNNNRYGNGASWVRGSIIGKGGFGCVYLATLKNPKSKSSYYPTLMAVKSAEVSVSGSIQKEREVLSNVKGCPNVIHCFGEETTMGQNGVLVYNLLLEYGSGGTLADRIRDSGARGLSELEVRFFTRSILRGLNHVHAIGYVHCDLKPENILLVSDNGGIGFRAKIGDFGLAKRAVPKQGKKRKLEPYWRGTPMYLSPEAVTESVQEPPCDVWSLGCLVLEMLTGKPPWDKDITVDEILEKIGTGLPKIPEGLSAMAKDFLKGCFVRNPRFRLTAEMLLSKPFVEGLGVEESETLVVDDLNEDESILIVSDSDDDDRGICDSDWSEYSYDLSEDEEGYYNEEDENVSSISEETELKEEDKTRSVLAKVPSQSRHNRYDPFSISVRAGI